MFLSESQELLMGRSELDLFIQEASILVEQMLAGKGEIILEAGDEEKTREAAEKWEKDIKEEIKKQKRNDNGPGLARIRVMFIAGLILFGVVIFFTAGLWIASFIATVSLVFIWICKGIITTRDLNKLKEDKEWIVENRKKLQNYQAKAKDPVAKEKIGDLLDEIQTYEEEIDKKLEINRTGKIGPRM